MTFTENVHEEPGGKVAPERLIRFEPARAEIIPPPQLPVKPFGVETSSPSSVLLKVIPVIADTGSGLLIMKVRVVLPPNGMVGAPNEMAITGAAPTAATTLQFVRATVFVSNVTAPLRASALPDKVAPVLSVMLVKARIFPLKVVVEPSVAELPTCQNRLQSEPPLIMVTDELLAVVSELPMRNDRQLLGFASD